MILRYISFKKICDRLIYELWNSVYILISFIESTTAQQMSVRASPVTHACRLKHVTQRENCILKTSRTGTKRTVHFSEPPTPLETILNLLLNQLCVCDRLTRKKKLILLPAIRNVPSQNKALYVAQNTINSFFYWYFLVNANREHKLEQRSKQTDIQDVH